MSDLLPCPFCGSDAVKTWSQEYGDCAHCGNDECAASAFYDRVMVSEWNTRHTPDGWQMVPVEPTSEMCSYMEYPSQQWESILAAAPEHGGSHAAN